MLNPPKRGYDYLVLIKQTNHLTPSPSRADVWLVSLRYKNTKITVDLVLELLGKGIKTEEIAEDYNIEVRMLTLSPMLLRSSAERKYDCRSLSPY